MDNKPQLIQSKIIDSEFGLNVKIIEPVNIYGCSIKENVFIGPFVEIQKNVTVGENTKIQSHSFICELVDIGKNCFIGHGVVFINDSFSDGGPAGGNINKWKATKISDNVSIGSNATILPVSITENVVIGAGSVVTKDIAPYTIVGGCPAKIIKKRFDEEIISGLLESKWWNLNDSDLKKLAKNIKDPIIFLKEYDSIKKK